MIHRLVALCPIENASEGSLVKWVYSGTTVSISFAYGALEFCESVEGFDGYCGFGPGLWFLREMTLELRVLRFCIHASMFCVVEARSV